MTKILFGKKDCKHEFRAVEVDGSWPFAKQGHQECMKCGAQRGHYALTFDPNAEEQDDG